MSPAQNINMICGKCNKPAVYVCDVCGDGLCDECFMFYQTRQRCVLCHSWWVDGYGYTRIPLTPTPSLELNTEQHPQSDHTRTYPSQKIAGVNINKQIQTDASTHIQQG